MENDSHNHDVRARQPLHDKITKDIEEFERRNGRVEKIPSGVMSSKPGYKYGSFIDRGEE